MAMESIESNGSTGLTGLTGSTGKTDEQEFEYVGFWLRVLATFIDTILLMVVMVPLLIAVYGEDALADGVTLSGPANILLSYVLPAIVVIAFWSSKHATPGKMVIRARIVDARTGAPPKLRQHVVRYLGYFLSTFFLLLGFIWVAFDKKKQGWHDKLAGTVVVRPIKHGTEPVRFPDRVT
jgi:uncharacterized RDD family membrane protein YckC